MMTKFNLIGQVFDRLKVIAKGEGYTSPKGYKSSTWVCQCDCGKTVELSTSNLKKGSKTSTVKSCGCYKNEAAKKRLTIHGKSKTKEYNCWKGIKERCYNPNNQAYKNYGGRGISVYDKWKDDFEAFLTDMGKAPTKTATIERIDVNKNYEPSNCIWLEKKLQPRNCRTTKLNVEKAKAIRQQLKLGAKVKDLAKQFNCSESTIYNIKSNRNWKDLE